MNKLAVYTFGSIIALGTFGFFNPNLREAYESYQHEKEMEKLVIQTNMTFENYNSITRKMSATLNEQRELVISHVELNGFLKEESTNPFKNALLQKEFHSEQIRLMYCDEYRKKLQYNGRFFVKMEINNYSFAREFSCDN